MRIHENVLEKENLDHLIKLTQSMSQLCEEKNKSLTSDQKDLLRDLFKWLSEVKRISDFPDELVVDYILYPIAGDLNRIADILKETNNPSLENFDNLLQRIYYYHDYDYDYDNKYQPGLNKKQSQTAHFLIYWATEGNWGELVNKFEGPYAKSIKKKTGSSNIATYYYGYLTEAEANDKSRTSLFNEHLINKI